MAHLLTQKDTPEPNRWRFIRGDTGRKWREEVRDRVKSRRSTTEFDVGRHNDLEEAPGNREQGVVEAPAAEKPREARETVEELTRLMLENILSGTEQERLRRVQLLKQTTGMGHLSDADALEQLSTLARKLAQMDAERRYAEMGINKPVEIR
jgi:hypothetical protein